MGQGAVRCLQVPAYRRDRRRLAHDVDRQDLEAGTELTLEPATPELKFHVNPETGRPNQCDDPLGCDFGGEDFHYESKHDAQVAWKARQLERGIIAYRNVMQARERAEEEQTLLALAKKAQGGARKLSWSAVRSLLVRNMSKYLMNFTGLLVSYLVISGRWLRDDWVRRLLPIIATVAFVGFAAWFGIRIYRGSRKGVRVVKKKRQARREVKKAAR